tara:strand:+ start:272 stop:439 length:168 start_codon:yes stop_codon:yes gene_type:complete
MTTKKKEVAKKVTIEQIDELWKEIQTLNKIGEQIDSKLVQLEVNLDRIMKRMGLE